MLGLLVTGASDEGIAGALGITARTVEVHVDHVRALRPGLFVPSH